MQQCAAAKTADKGDEMGHVELAVDAGHGAEMASDPVEKALVRGVVAGMDLRLGSLLRSEPHPHKRLQLIARELVGSSQSNAMTPGQLRQFNTDVAGYLQDVAIDVAFMTPRQTD